MDEVALLMIEDALLVYRDEIVQKAELERAAWADAYRQSAEALAAAR